MQRKGRLAGIDYGTVRIGIAISDPSQSFSSPYESFNRGDEETNKRRFIRLASEEDLVGFVVGLPIHTDGSESAKSIEARQFGKWIQDVTSLPVEFFDERYTSVEAENALLDAGLTKKKRKARIDMLAAQIILQGYLDWNKDNQDSSETPNNDSPLDDR